MLSDDEENQRVNNEIQTFFGRRSDSSRTMLPKLKKTNALIYLLVYLFHSHHTKHMM